ncbi:MAG: 50S ribosome-binding GTPase, partial [Planctomycetaceae bacterium]|nr:50S ribosome-binding GTPase [Planctomycetaceae bacterium]
RETLTKLFPGENWNRVTRPERVEVSIELPDWPPIPVDVYFWPTAKSFTGEPLAELHLTAASPVVQAVLQQTYAAGVRAAEPGEFTQRAFLNQRIDLLQAEAVLGVIDAHSQQQLETALSQLAGGISSRMHELREVLLLHLADLEAGLDFVEEDIEFVQRDELSRRLDEACEWLSVLAAQSEQRMLTAIRPQVVLAGNPNAGKSSLFNALTETGRSLTSGQSGTTRDYVLQTVEWDGLELDLVDTAGWEDEVQTELDDAMNVQRVTQYERADLILWCTASDLSEEERRLDQTRRERLTESESPLLDVLTKSDLQTSDDSKVASVSVVTGSGLAELRTAIADALREQSRERDSLLGASSARCREAIRLAFESLQRARGLIEMHEGDELIAIEMRTALNHLGEIVGEVYTDDILDRIFSRFCIGK